MNQIERLDHIPQLLWTRNSSQEFLAEDVIGIEKRSEFIWKVSLDVPVLVAGLIYTSYVNPPWLWFLLTDAFETRQLSTMKFMRKLAPFLPPGTTTSVVEDYEPGKRFAEFFGFEPVGETVLTYKIYRRP